MRLFFILLPLLFAQAPTAGKAAEGQLLDLTGARVVFPRGSSGPERKAVDLLVGEAARRTQVRWTAGSVWPEGGAAVIALGREELLRKEFGDAIGETGGGGPPPSPEGYRITLQGGSPPARLWVSGNDPRGVLFGAGRLLRMLRMEKGKIAAPAEIHHASSPRFPLRGHQLGYRPKTNSYDGWSLPVWEEYIRDLAVFGTNAVELIPPRSDDAAESPHFPLPPLEMMEGMSRLLDDYGLDVWIWYPAMDKDYANPATVEFALKEWGEVFRRLPRIDAVFVPGGDPGHTRPNHLMALLEKETQVLHQSHPRAQMWVSPQSFSKEWLDEFLGLLKDEPPWLTGIVYGPQVRGSLSELRAAVPRRYPIRHYPDITHSRQCQYPVPDWDLAYAVTEGREVINPRPRAQAHIFRFLSADTTGFITYSEGCNDDVNKFVWSALGWDPEADLVEVLREYGRYFLGEPYQDNFAQGLLALERNWEEPLISNGGVSTTLAQFQALERTATPALLENWRFQEALYRAYYDGYTRSRLIYETALEEEALSILTQARKLGSRAAIERARAALDRASSEGVRRDLRSRVFELAEALFQSIHMQLSVERYRAISVDRGANLDTIDVPLNDGPHLRRALAEIKKLKGERERLQAIESLLHRTDPGPGGFYDDLGDPLREPHLVRGPGFLEDPAFLRSALTGFGDHRKLPRAWWHHAESLGDAPLEMRYPGLDPSARYRLRVVYGGDSAKRQIRLEAGEGLEVHPLIEKPSPVEPLEFDIPEAATAHGELRLRWYRAPGLGGNGRGCQVSEVWLQRR
jgi:hypothetical protein